MTNVDVGGGDRLALAVLVQYRMATTEQMHWVIAPGVRIEQTRRRLARLREAGLADRITLPQAGRTRVWFPSSYGVQLAYEWPEMRGRRPSRTVSDPTAVRLKVGHALTVTETALAFLKDARRHGDLCRPLDWIPEVHHPIGSGEAVIPDALLYYRHGSDGDGSMLRAFVEVDRATMGPPTPRRQTDRLRPPPPLHAHRPGTPADPPGTGTGRLAAALSPVPAAAVRPGRHRPHRCQDAYSCPACGRQGVGGVQLSARGACARGPR